MTSNKQDNIKDRNWPCIKPSETYDSIIQNIVQNPFPSPNALKGSNAKVT